VLLGEGLVIAADAVEAALDLAKLTDVVICCGGWSATITLASSVKTGEEERLGLVVFEYLQQWGMKPPLRPGVSEAFMTARPPSSWSGITAAVATAAPRREVTSLIMVTMMTTWYFGGFCVFV
jgi:hypothetical protein